MKIKLSELLHFTDKQKIASAMADKHKYTLFGGAAGPGKSYWLRWYSIAKLIKWYKKTGFQGIRAGLFCEDYPSLTDRHISKIQYEIPAWLGKIKNSKTDGLALHLTSNFGNGVLAFRNLDDPSKYMSSEFALVAIDELTMNQKEVFDVLRIRNRWTGIEDTRMIMGTNPGQIGHAWVKKIWLDKEFDENEKESKEFAYVPALPSDNPYLAESYLKALDSLPEKKRKAYKEGNWDIFEGQYFTEWDRKVHVIEPFIISDHWRRIRGIDHGRTAPTACLWGAIDSDGRIYWYKEYYKAGVDADINAGKIHEMSLLEKYWFTVLDQSCFSKTGSGETIAEIYMKNGVIAEPSPKNRLAGWNLMHEYLRLQEDNKPKMMFFSNCVNSIRTIPTLIHDDNRPEDLNTKGDDHCADSISYALQYLHEGRSPKEESPVMLKLKEFQTKHGFSPQNINRIYGQR